MSAKLSSSGSINGNIINSSSISSNNNNNNNNININSKKRYVWPESLHRDFISAVFDVGLRMSTLSEVQQAMLSELRERDRERDKDVESQLLQGRGSEALLQKLRVFRDRHLVQRSTHFESEQKRFTVEVGVEGKKSVVHNDNPLFEKRETTTTTSNRAEGFEEEANNNEDKGLEDDSESDKSCLNGVAVDQMGMLIYGQLQQLARTIQYQQHLYLHLQKSIPRQQEVYFNLLGKVNDIDPKLTSLFQSSLHPFFLPVESDHALHSLSGSHLNGSGNVHESFDSGSSVGSDKEDALLLDSLGRSNGELFHHNNEDTDESPRKRTRSDTDFITKQLGQQHPADNSQPLILNPTAANQDEQQHQQSSRLPISTSRAELNIMSEMRAQMDIHRLLLLKKENQLSQLGGIPATNTHSLSHSDFSASSVAELTGHSINNFHPLPNINVAPVTLSYPSNLQSAGCTNAGQENGPPTWDFELTDLFSFLDA